MNPAMPPRMRDDSWLPALAAAVVLHVLVFALVVLFGLPKVKMGGTAVPINIVANAPTTDSRAAEQAPQTQTAQTETPTPEAPPEATPPAQSTPAPPTPAPPKSRPAPPPPKPAPAKTVTPLPKPVPTKTVTPPPKLVPAPAKPAPPVRPQPAPSFDLNKLQDSLNGAINRANAASKPSSAPHGPPRRETAPQPRPSAGVGVSTSDIAGLGDLLNRLWNKSCEGDAPADVTAKISVDADGRVPNGSLRIFGHNGNLIVLDSKAFLTTQNMTPEETSAVRARSAITRVQPYAPQFRGQTFTINFNASKACANR